MAFDPAFLDELRARTPLASVIGRRARLTRSGRNWKGCCPFHGEKTPSFYVYDDHFHCFGCGVHGDVISFVMQSGGHSFPDAVAALASEAGLEMPRQDPRAQQEAARARTLADALDAAQRWFTARLRAAEGQAGLAYLRGRGLSEASIESFGLGWSGDGRGGLAEALKQQNIDPALMAEAGLLRLDEAGRPKGELFFGRVTFPIRDRRGRLISFGGRALGDAQPKYLNGPETRLFSKRLVLFGLDRAREAVRAPHASPPASELVVVEGYMDVIALHQAGFGGAVAPLGTALTAEQLEALWRVAPVPVLCFDGDAAGRRAAIRAAETALPLLAPERSLRFCRLPEGEDPDSLLRRQGAAALGRILSAARPLGEVLFGLLSEGISNPGPEQRAALHGRLVEAAGRIGNRTLAAEYRRTLLDRFFETFRRGREAHGPRGVAGGRQRPGITPLRAPPQPAPASRLAPEPQQARLERMRILTAILLRHPELLRDVEEAYCTLELPEDLKSLRRAMVDWASHAHPDSASSSSASSGNAAMTTIGHDAPDSLDTQELVDHLKLRGLSAHVDKVLGEEPLPLLEQVKPGDMPAELEKRWWHYFGLLNYPRLEQERQASLHAWVERNDEPSERRLRALSEACAALRAGEQADEDGWG